MIPDEKLSHHLVKGQRLREVITAPAPDEGCATYRLGLEPHHAREIVVVEEMGQMSMVPWAKVTRNSGTVVLLNLAACESVTLLPEEAGQDGAS